MELGAFSVSLAVKDLETSKAFYETLGFEVFGGDMTENWLIMKNGFCVIGLFQGMFDRNLLTFNPGWDQEARTLESFAGIREIRRRLEAAGVVPEPDIHETETGPGSFMIADPDGNPILFDQHVGGE